MDEGGSFRCVTRILFVASFETLMIFPLFPFFVVILSAARRRSSCTIVWEFRQKAGSSESAKPTVGQSTSPAADPTGKTPRSSSLVSRC
jgi:hypothetical protein